MTRISLLVVLLSATPVFAQDVTFKEDLRQFVMNGDDTEKVDVSLTMSADTLTVTPKKKGAVLTIPYTAISNIVYDRRARVRKMFVGARGNIGGKATDHFLTIQFKTAGGAGSFIEVEMGKDAAPRVLNTLEARSGQKIERAGG